MAAANSNPFEINDFSGGITDHIFEQVLNRHDDLDNILIGHDKKPYSRPGSEPDDTNNTLVPTGKRVGGLLNYANSDKLFYQSDKSIFYRNPSAFSEFIGPTGHKVFSVGDENSVASFAQWNRHVYVTSDAFPRPMKIYKDGSGLYQVRSSGLPALANTPTVTATVAGDQSFLYAFHYLYDYTVFNLAYQSIGSVTEVQLQNSADPSMGPVQITNIPVLDNGLYENFDIANIKVAIFRSVNNGTFLQKVGEVTNGTTTFTDSMDDTTLENTGADLYTNDGTVDYDQVPLHKYNNVVNNTGYYANIIDTDGESPYKIRQSIPGIPDTAPIDFEASVDDEIRGISSVRNLPIVLCKKYIYRIDQAFDSFGRGGMVPARISDTAGCISHNSCVQAENGLFWLGNEGIWYTDGYLAQKISDIADRYKSIIKNTTQTTRITGRFYEKERLVIWTIQRDSSNADNDSFLVLDLKWGVREESTFTTWSGNSFRPTAIEVFNNQIYRGDIRGFVLLHDDSLSADKKIDQYRPASEWVDETIMWTIGTINYNFNGTFFRKMPTRVLLTAANNGNTTIQIQAINDDGKVIRNCKVIRVRNNFVWRDDDFIWRVSPFVWRNTGMIEQWRRFPAGGLRLSHLKLVITNGFSDIQNSDSLGTATFSGVAKTAILDTPTSKWPLESEDYFISTEVDNYVKQFLISKRDSDSTVLITDPTNTFPTGPKKWVIRGYKKGEALYLLGFNIHWNNVSQSQTTYSSAAADTGENA